jgi:hypothetical protein
VLNQDEVANSDSLDGAAKDAFYPTSFLCSSVWSVIEHENKTYFSFFKVLAGMLWPMQDNNP